MNMAGSFKVQLVNMGTRAAACKFFSCKIFSSEIFIFFNFLVQSKLRSLHDFHLRLLQHQQSSIPAPSGVDIANTIKYFSQTLMSKLNY